MAVTREWIHVQTWSYGRSVGFELVLPVDQLDGYHWSTKFVSLGPGGRVGGDGLLVLRYPEPQTGEPEELALRLSRDDDVMRALHKATGRSADEG